MTLYLFFPLYYKIFVRFKQPLVFLAISFGLWLAVAVGGSEVIRGNMYGFINRIPIFLMGVYFGWLVQNKKIVFNELTWIMMSVIFALGLYLAYLTNYKDLFLLVRTSNCCVPNFLISISLPFIIAGVFEAVSDIHILGGAAAVICKIFRFYGAMSLEFYCVQEKLGFFVIEKLRLFTGSSIVINIITFAVITMVAFIMSKIFAAFWKAVAKKS